MKSHQNLHTYIGIFTCYLQKNKELHVFLCLSPPFAKAFRPDRPSPAPDDVREGVAEDRHGGAEEQHEASVEAANGAKKKEQKE